MAACSRSAPSDRSSLTFLIEANPTNLDPRYATDAQSQRIDSLLFSSLVERDEQMNPRGDLAERWETPGPLTYIFHLRPGVRFHDGRAVTAADVKFTLDWILNAANRSPKRGAFRMVTSVDAPDASTVIFHLKEPYASFLWNLSRRRLRLPGQASAAGRSVTSASQRAGHGCVGALAVASVSSS